MYPELESRPLRIRQCPFHCNQVLIQSPATRQLPDHLGNGVMRGTFFFGLGSWQVWHPAVAVGGQVGRLEVHSANRMHTLHTCHVTTLFMTPFNTERRGHSFELHRAVLNNRFLFFF